jgi:hypothetical protein
MSIQNSNIFNIRIEILNIKKPKTNGLLYGIIKEISDNYKYNNFKYIFCAPTICSILLCLFRFNNCKVIIFPYLCKNINHTCNQLFK